eukprot:CAMPEP_0197863374 /NCGR_PEP_ID=MMETSP1438-20131217/40794_1 /TAXON_ID=1461541 /ORGANISM="Pterosperma sp., Strain CCMP1384" /LENGTH=142 /DNA_ID=CAMNT_0043481247 /DNA_START=157 /DNA_END=586 /DNA_ORIENTATION=-
MGVAHGVIDIEGGPLGEVLGESLLLALACILRSLSADLAASTASLSWFMPLPPLQVERAPSSKESSPLEHSDPHPSSSLSRFGGLSSLPSLSLAPQLQSWLGLQVPVVPLSLLQHLARAPPPPVQMRPPQLPPLGTPFETHA